jgi:ZIP family zinc transporter
MAAFLANSSSIVQALVATAFTWALTAVGAASVFLFKEVNQKALGAMLGFAAGVMIAASYWSLLAPAIETSREGPLPAWLPPAAGFVLGAGFLRGIDRLLPHLHLGFPDGEREGIRTSWRHSTLLFSAVTLHNIPEGLAIGVAFGAVAADLPAADLPAAVSLAIGIGIQNLPEGLAISLPLRGEGLSRGRCFWYGQLSGSVEPVAAVLGAALVTAAQPVLPYALAFAAGAMIFVVVEEIVPESQHGGNADVATLGSVIGFALMMTLDVAFS